jgi:hypothetical protein
MLNLIGSTLGMMAIMICLVALAIFVTNSNRSRLIIAGGFGAWVGLAIGLAASGALAVTPGQPVPIVGILFFTPLISTVLLWVTVPRFRQALYSIPTPLLIGLNTFRVLGVLFLFLAAAGRLSGPFPYSAGWGDIITGAFAIPVAILAARGLAHRRSVFTAWNLFGTADLIVAVGLGLTSAEGSPLQLIRAGVGSEAMQYLPFSLVPTVLVPFFLITHGIVAAQIASSRRKSESVTASRPLDLGYRKAG